MRAAAPDFPKASTKKTNERSDLACVDENGHRANSAAKLLMIGDRVFEF
jgi:hypothetical protein